jgi:hypothetical protein
MNISIVLSRFNMPSDDTQQEFILFWNSLTVETKVIILHFLLEEEHPDKIFDKWAPLYWRKFIDRVSSEENQYLKCLGSKLENKYSDDTSHTIRFSTEEFEKEFWSLSPDIRFSLVRYFDSYRHRSSWFGEAVYYSKSEILLRLVKYAHEIAQEMQENDRFAFWQEVECVLDEYASKFFSPSYYDYDFYLLGGMSVFLLGEELKRHWEIITFIPVYTSMNLCAKYLDFVPYTDCLFSQIDEELLNKLHTDHLEHIFKRKDVTLYNERRAFVLDRENINPFAAYCNFKLKFNDLNKFVSDQFIHKVLVNHENISFVASEIKAILRYSKVLAYAQELDIVFYQIGLDILASTDDVQEARENINDLLIADDYLFFDAYEMERIIERNLKNRIIHLDPQGRFINLLKLRAYYLAKKVVSDAEYPLNGDFETLRDLVNKSNVYETYKNFCDFFLNRCDESFDKRSLYGHILYHELAEQTYIDDEVLKFDIRLKNYEVETLQNIQNILGKTSSFVELGRVIYGTGVGIILLYLAYSILKPLSHVFY